jgi:high-affinity nickel-transport protein
MTTGGLSLWALGILLGLRHALEPDHLAAVSTLAGAERGPRAAVGLGVAWGLGHTLALLAVATVLAAAQAALPPRLGTAFELGVGAMLVLLGVSAVARGWRRAASPTVAPPAASRAFARRSLVVGLLHGLAGSGALTVLVAAQLASPWGRVAYVALVGVGSMLGMAAVSGLAGVPLARAGARPGLARAIAGLAGLVALGLGVTWIWRAAAALAA